MLYPREKTDCVLLLDRENRQRECDYDMKKYNYSVIFLLALLCLTLFACWEQAPDIENRVDRVKALLYELELPDDALALATKTLEEFPAHSMLYYHRGMARMALKKYTAALDDFAVAAKTDPKNAMAFNGLGNVFYLKYEDAVAERYYKRGLELSADDPTRALFLGNLSLLESGKKSHVKAVKMLLEALSLSNDGRYYNLLGRSYLAIKDKKKARETWTKAVADASVTYADISFRHNTLYRLASLLMDQRNYKDAMLYCGQALDLSPSNSEYVRLYNKLHKLTVKK